MELKDLKSLVKKGEGYNLEFKLKTNHPEKIAKEIAAFANSGGGKLLLGISDDLMLKGLKYPDEDEYLIEKSIRKHISPSPEYDIERIKLDNEREIVVFDIKESTEKPLFYQTDTEEKKIFVRNEDKSIQASKEVREILKGQSKDRSFRFEYGEKERVLMSFLEKNKEITVSGFSEIANISKKNASRTLILLVLAGVLKVSPNESEDLFMSKESET
ncbi:MAG: ATP-binding protein [Cytophagaceae bacterium]|nr:ATP-binding protein [Cytophagaceae bacterium]MBK9508656.1 ATP-binding protein [Cytophagaceae bacterium]MBK9935325.1 ATP-binding protein [Cytophagaceae bacterium]MBL0301767.1 ATP-binding protein [Cytophagaceae bacterium]MBL0324593.1 ATP-binding protein [Cytophagaceae bacterium]